MKRYLVAAVAVILAAALCGCGADTATESAAVTPAAATPIAAPAVTPAPTPGPTSEPSPSPTAINYADCWTKTPEEEADLEQRIQDFLNGKGLFTEEKLARNNIWDLQSYLDASTDEFLNGLSPTKLGIMYVDNNFFFDSSGFSFKAQVELLDFVVRDGDICCLVGYQSKDEDGKLKRHTGEITFPKECNDVVGGYFLRPLDQKYLGATGWGNYVNIDQFASALENEINEAIIIDVGFVKASDEDMLSYGENWTDFFERYNNEGSIQMAQEMLRDMWVVDEYSVTRDNFVTDLMIDTLDQLPEINSVYEYKKMIVEGRSGCLCISLETYDSSMFEH